MICRIRPNEAVQPRHKLNLNKFFRCTNKHSALTVYYRTLAMHLDIPEVSILGGLPKQEGIKA